MIVMELLTNGTGLTVRRKRNSQIQKNIEIFNAFVEKILYGIRVKSAFKALMRIAEHACSSCKLSQRALKMHF